MLFAESPSEMKRSEVYEDRFHNLFDAIRG
jgi:hypothetical protein